MLTEEQIKNLKKGDKLIAEVQFYSLDRDGDIVCLAALTTSSGDVIETSGFYHPSCLSLPTAEPKHDPCRKFKKGDKVKLIEWNGRTPYDTHHELKPSPGEVHIVIEDEYDRNEVHIGMNAADEHQSVVHACHLELVTPVEELEPYFVLDSPRTFNICKHGGGKSVATFYKDQPLAREHAEKYCAALNAEYRKELK